MQLHSATSTSRHTNFTSDCTVTEIERAGHLVINLDVFHPLPRLRKTDTFCRHWLTRRRMISFFLRCRRLCGPCSLSPSSRLVFTKFVLHHQLAEWMLLSGSILVCRCDLLNRRKISKIRVCRFFRGDSLILDHTAAANTSAFTTAALVAPMSCLQ